MSSAFRLCLRMRFRVHGLRVMVWYSALRIMRRVSRHGSRGRYISVYRRHSRELPVPTAEQAVIATALAFSWSLKAEKVLYDDIRWKKLRQVAGCQ
jgi:hypothetical protein